MKGQEYVKARLSNWIAHTKETLTLMEVIQQFADKSRSAEEFQTRVSAFLYHQPDQLAVHEVDNFIASIYDSWNNDGADWETWSENSTCVECGYVFQPMLHQGYLFCSDACRWSFGGIPEEEIENA